MMGRLYLRTRAARQRPCLRPAELMRLTMVSGWPPTRQLCEMTLLGEHGESEQTLGRLAKAMDPLCS